MASAAFDAAVFASLAFAGVVVPDFCAAAVFAPPDACAVVVFADGAFADEVDFFADDRSVAASAVFLASDFFAACAFAVSFFAAVAFALVFFASAVFGLDFFAPAFVASFFADVFEDDVFVFDDEPAFADEPAFIDVAAFAVDSLVPDFFAGAVFADFFPAFFFAVVAAAEPFAGTPPDPAFADDERFAFDDFVGAFVVDVFDDADSSAMDQVYSRVTSGEGARGGASQMIPNADATAEVVRTRPPRRLTMRKVLTPRRPGASWRVRRGATLAGVGTAEDRGMTGIP
ncbi:hypothetical protein [Brevibacterium ihuae]|uniref:hypothetical protein n=1 Tax=Brevibacterium ihuae TaxID=1631743 RepID=UPI000C77EBC2|nr:hypothetical protein [Brevibacterium ihuae]